MSTLPLLTTLKSANAITPKQALKSYDTYTATYGNLNGGSIALSLGIDEARRNLLRTTKGDVLEIGGKGLFPLAPIYLYFSLIHSITAQQLSIPIIPKGCIYNQNVGEMIRQTKGLQITKEEAFAAGLFWSFTCRKI